MTDDFWGKIIQIMPAPAGMSAVYSIGGDRLGEFRVPVIGFGLTDKGYVVPLEIDGDGLIGIIGETRQNALLRIEAPGL